MVLISVLSAATLLSTGMALHYRNGKKLAETRADHFMESYMESLDEIEAVKAKLVRAEIQSSSVKDMLFKLSRCYTTMVSSESVRVVSKESDGTIVTIKIFPFSYGDEDDFQFAMSEAVELIEILTEK